MECTRVVWHLEDATVLVLISVCVCVCVCHFVLIRGRPEQDLYVPGCL